MTETKSAVKLALLRRISRPEFWLALLLAWATLSAARSLGTPWRVAAQTEWLRWSLGIAFALSIGQGLIRTRHWARLATLAAGCLCVSGFSRELSAGGMMTGPFGDHQLFGSALLLGLPVSISVGLTSHSTRWRWGGQCVAALTIACLILSQSRSAWAGASAGLGVFAFLWVRVGQGKRKGQQTPMLLAAGVLIAVAVIAGTTQEPATLASRVQTLGALKSDQGWQTRGLTWQGAGRMVSAAPAAGWGLGRYPGAQQKFTHQGRLLTPNQRPSLSEEAHSFYWQTLAEMGWPGLAFYLMALLMLAGRCIYVLRRLWGHAPGRRAGQAIATLALLAAQAVDAMASPSWQFGELSLPFWGLLGLGMAATAYRTERPEPEALLLPHRARMTLASAVCLGIALLVLPMLPPVEAYALVNGVQLTSITVTPSRAILHMAGKPCAVVLTATGHYRYLQTGLPAPDRTLTFDGPPDGVTGTQFVAQGAFLPNLETNTGGRTGFQSLAPCERNILTVDAREASPCGGIVTVRAKCSVADSLGSHLCTSQAIRIACFP